jgi:hypothetical protein
VRSATENLPLDLGSSCAEAICERSTQFRKFVARPGEIDNHDGFRLGFGNRLSDAGRPVAAYARVVFAETGAIETSTARRK